MFFWDGLPSSALITQAELGSSILAKFSYVVPDLSRVACQVFQLYYLGTSNPLRYVARAARCLLPMYCQSTFLPVWGCHLFFVFQLCISLCISLLRVSWCTCQVPLIFLGSRVSLCCQMFPNVLSKHHQSVWGSYTCLLLVLDWAQLILHLSRWAAVAGLQVLLPSASNVLSKYLWSVWGSHFSCLSVVSLLMYLPSTFNLPGESRQFWLPGVS